MATRQQYPCSNSGDRIIGVATCRSKDVTFPGGGGVWGASERSFPALQCDASATATMVANDDCFIAVLLSERKSMN